MRNFLAILERELKSYFLSPVAYVVLGFFLIVTGLFYYSIINYFDRMSMQAMMRQMPQPMNVNQMAIRPLLQNMTVILLFLVPGITMRLFAEEKRQGTMELLATSPLSNWQITFGKFAAALVFYFVMLLATGVFIGLLFIFGNPEVMPILTGYLGLLLVGGCFISLGLLFSAFTENQIIAFVGAFAANLAILALGWLANFVGPTLGAFLTNLSPLEHFEDFAKGIIDTKHLIFYASFMFGGIFLTYVTVESSRWRGAR